MVMQKNLSFKDRALEKDFIFTRQNFHIISFRNFIITLAIQSSTIYISNPLGLNILEWTKLIPFIGLLIVVIIAYLVVGIKFVRFCSLALPISVFLYNVASSEIVHLLKREISLEPWIYFFLGINLQTACLLLITSRIRWTYTLLMISFINVFSWMRIIEVFQVKDSQSTALACMLINIFLLCSITYSNEKGDRSYFQKLKSNCRLIEGYEELLMTAMPTSVIIMKGDKIEFMNEMTKSSLGVMDRSEITSALKKIRVVQRENVNKFMSTLQNEVEKKDKNLHSLYEFIRNHELSWAKSEPTKGFSFIEAVINNDVEEFSKCLACQVGPITWKGKLCVLVVASDVTVIKDHYSDMDAYKDNLLATVSHDMRTPLNGMLGMLELMMEEAENEAKKEKIAVTMSSSRLLLSMINDILDFSLISKGKLRLKFEPTNATSLVEETVRILQMQAKLKGTDLIIQNGLESKEENHIIDGNRIRQVLLNLIGNAIKFTNSGKIYVKLEEETYFDYDSAEINSKELISIKKINHEEEEQDICVSNRRKCLVFEVADNGIGIKPFDQAKLFKLYSRVNVEEGENKNGIGLGLAISQRLVCMMNSNRPGAKISVVSEYGKGSKFSFPIYIERDPSILFKEVTGFENKIPQNFEAKTFDRFQSKDLSPTSPNSKKLPNLHFPPALNFSRTSNFSPASNLSPASNFFPNSVLESEGDLFISPFKNNINVLVVDDDQINILVAKSYLNSLGGQYVVFAASNGKEALQKVSDSAKNNLFFDIILMDCNMPLMDGYEASTKLRSLMSEGLIPYTPIVAITANAGNKDKEKCLASGMDCFLTKPYSKAQLLATIKNSMKNSR